MKKDPYHVQFPEKIFVPPCPKTINEKALDKALDELFKHKVKG
jgi:hypothetical protein